MLTLQATDARMLAIRLRFGSGNGFSFGTGHSSGDGVDLLMEWSAGQAENPTPEKNMISLEAKKANKIFKHAFR